MDTKRRGKPAKKKKSKKGKKKKPIDDAAAELAAENEKKELVESLVAKTDLEEEEILAAYEEFYEKYPSGEITEKQFLQQSKVICNWLAIQNCYHPYRAKGVGEVQQPGQYLCGEGLKAH